MNIPKPEYIEGIEAATGSLGHGLPMALGMALAGKIKKKTINVLFYLVMENVMKDLFGNRLFSQLRTILIILSVLDFNKWQATGRSNNIMKLEPFEKNGNHLIGMFKELMDMIWIK